MNQFSDVQGNIKKRKRCVTVSALMPSLLDGRAPLAASGAPAGGAGALGAAVGRGRVVGGGRRARAPGAGRRGGRAQATAATTAVARGGRAPPARGRGGWVAGRGARVGGGRAVAGGAAGAPLASGGRGRPAARRREKKKNTEFDYCIVRRRQIHKWRLCGRLPWRGRGLVGEGLGGG